MAHPGLHHADDNSAKGKGWPMAHQLRDGLQEIWVTIDVLQGSTEAIDMTEELLAEVFSAGKLTKGMKDFVKLGISWVRVSEADMKFVLKTRTGAWRPLTAAEKKEQMDEMGFVESRPDDGRCIQHLTGVLSSGIMMSSAHAKTCVADWDLKKRFLPPVCCPRKLDYQNNKRAKTTAGKRGMDAWEQWGGRELRDGVKVWIKNSSE